MDGEREVSSEFRLTPVAYEKEQQRMVAASLTFVANLANLLQVTGGHAIPFHGFSNPARRPAVKSA